MINKQFFDKNDMLEYLQEFVELYDKRIIKDNNGGMKSSHIFPIWYVLKKTKPKYIVESGVWKGLGTWFFEQASPYSKIISIDPNPSFRVYTSPNVEYTKTDFINYNWDGIDKNDTLLFFDDHQNSLERIKHAKKLGFKKMVFEDNYPYLQGDCYSPKKILSKKKYVIDSMGIKNWFEPNEDDYQFFIKNVLGYQEFPPLFKDNITRWGDDWDNENYETNEPLLSESDVEIYPTFFEERKDYTWICYLEL